MINYKCAYLKLLEDSNYALTIHAHFPIDGITYNDTKVGLEESGGTWKDVKELGDDGWQLIYVANRNMHMVGVFIREDKKYEINQIKSSLTTQQIKFIVDELAKQFPKIETPKLEPFDISNSIQKFNDQISNFKIPTPDIPKIEIPNKEVNESIIDLVKTLDKMIYDFNKKISTLLDRLCELPNAKTIVDTVSNSVVHYCENIVIPLKPKPPLSRMIYDFDDGPFCPSCGSSLRKKWFRRTSKCIQPECSNYYDKPNQEIDK